MTERTIQLHFPEIKASLFQLIQVRELRSLKLALLELDELSREAWVLYHRPARGLGGDRDQSPLLMDLLRISQEKTGCCKP